MKICPVCQRQFEDALKFCTEDGAKLDTVSEEEAPALIVSTSKPRTESGSVSVQLPPWEDDSLVGPVMAEPSEEDLRFLIRASRPRWVSWAAAGAVFVVVAIVAILFFRGGDTPSKGNGSKLFQPQQPALPAASSPSALPEVAKPENATTGAVVDRGIRLDAAAPDSRSADAGMLADARDAAAAKDEAVRPTAIDQGLVDSGINAAELSVRSEQQRVDDQEAVTSPSPKADTPNAKKSVALKQKQSTANTSRARTAASETTSRPKVSSRRTRPAKQHQARPTRIEKRRKRAKRAKREATIDPFAE